MRNPVRDNLCEDALDYRWSSAAFWQDERYVGEDYVLDLKALIAEFAPAVESPGPKASTESCEEEGGE